ncbi:hypothetical protein ACFQ0Q_17155 [Streptomyces aureus]
MDLDALRHLNFSQLDDAIDDWDQMARGLKTVADNAEKNLKGKADRANWTGYNAAVTREFVDKTSGSSVTPTHRRTPSPRSSRTPVANWGHTRPS